MIKRFTKFRYEVALFIIFLASRLPALGYDLFNTDVWKWKSRIFDFGTGVFTLNFEKTIQRYHPGVTLMWIGSLAVKVYNFGYEILYGSAPPNNTVTTVFQLHSIQKLFIVMVIGLALTYIFLLLRRIFNLRYAFIAVLLLSLEPFFVGLTRVIHLEGLMSAFMLASFVSLFAYFRLAKKSHYLVFSSLFAALSVLTKTASLFLIPMAGLMFLLENQVLFKKIEMRTLMRSLIQPYLTWLVWAVIFFILIWPAMWTHPISAISALYTGISETGVEEGHIQLYFSQLTEDPGLTFYPVVFYLRSSILLIFGTAASMVIYKSLDENMKRWILYVCLFSLFYAIEMSLPSKKLDRYLLPGIAVLWFAAAAFYYELLQKVQPFAVSLILLLLLPVYTLLALHPDYLAYYNPLAGGTAKGIFIIEPKWAFGSKDILAYFSELKYEKGYSDFAETESIDEYVNTPFISDKLVIGFPEKYYTQFWPFINTIGARATITDITGQAINTKYFVYPVWEDNSYEEDRFDLVKVGEIGSKGVKLYHVYERVSTGTEGSR